MYSASEVEPGALSLNAIEAVTIPNIFIDMGHLQLPTPIVTNNKCATEIPNDTVKQKRSKAIDMIFFWTVDLVKQKSFLIMWRPRSENLVNYFTKHHFPEHHKLVRLWYLLYQVDTN